MRVLVVGAAWAPGERSFYAGLAAHHDLVIAADAAAEWLLAEGVRPDVAVGDFDSASPGAVARLQAAGVRVTTYPRTKDDTDLQLAVRTARAAGATAVTLTGAFRARIDHTLAAVGLLAGLADLAGTVVEPDMRAWVADGVGCRELALDLLPGTVVSVLAVGGVAEGVTLGGFRYPLQDAALDPLSGLGVSNVVTAPVQSVRVSHGTLLVVAPD
jgi:thiamine pyrophosphokinase